jgi:hypothetical protein
MKQSQIKGNATMGKATFFGARRGVGPPRHPVSLRCVVSGLPIMPNRRRFGLQEGGIWRMPFGGPESALEHRKCEVISSGSAGCQGSPFFAITGRRGWPMTLWPE